LAGAVAYAELEPGATLGRREEPVELRGADLPQWLGLDLAEIAFFARRGAEWQPLPFQIDERGPKGGLFEADDQPGVLDANDSILFMQEDVGAWADTTAWLGGAVERRYQITLSDPISGGQGWVYGFSGEELPRSGADYVTIASVWPDEPFEIVTDRYRERFAPGNPALLEELRLSEQMGANGVDLFDRVKYRARISPLTPWLTEDDGSVDYKERVPIDGPVRAVNSFFISIGGWVDLMEGTVYFYRQMVVIETTVHQLIFPNLRHMLWISDANPEVTDFVFYNDAVEATLQTRDEVDGDGLRLLQSPGFFNEWVSPTAGGAVTVQDVYQIPADEYLNYYCDGCGETRWPETGDGVQWGQWGVWFKSIPFGLDIPTETWNVWLPPGTESRGTEFVARFAQRTQVTVSWQRQSPALVTSPGEGGTGNGLPARMRLHPPRPNPFNPHTTLLVEVPDGPLQLSVYDRSGQKVRVLASATLVAGQYAFVWDGRNDHGLAVASGLYWARLECAGAVREEPLLLIR
jgi:hypothetical protein